MKARMLQLFLYAALVITFGCKSRTHEPGHWERVPEILQNIREPGFPDQTYLLADFGAVADGLSDTKMAIDDAIRTCAGNGGGTIVFENGDYLINGPIHLENNIKLHITEGARLIFGHDPDDYLPVVLTSWEGTRLYNYSPFIYANGKNNIAITGTGIIDGSSQGVFNAWRPSQQKDQLLSRQMNNQLTPLHERVFGKDHFLRPHLLQFYECENILIDGVTILDAPFWCLHMIFSNNIVIKNLVFNSQQLNNDGIDIESSQFVLIENIRFNNNDDNIAIKAGRDLEGRTLQQASKNIIVRDCFFQGHNALAVGSEMSGGVYDIFVENCTYSGEVRNGIYLKSNKDRGGKVSDIHVRNIAFGEVDTMIRIDSDYKGEGESHPPAFENIFIEHVSASHAREYGLYIRGSENAPVRRVFLSDIEIGSTRYPAHIEFANDLYINNMQIK